MPDITIPTSNSSSTEEIAVYALMAGDGTPQGWSLVWFYNSYEEADRFVPKDNPPDYPTKWIVQPMTVAEALNKLSVSLLRGERKTTARMFNINTGNSPSER